MRFEHWERRLNAVIDKHGRLPHTWGERDCALFVAECVWALTQKNPGDAWRKTYSDAAGAARVIAQHGGLEGLVETGLRNIGVPVMRIPPLTAQRGDVCMLGREDMPALGVCAGAEIIGKSTAGLERRPLAAATVVWAIR